MKRTPSPHNLQANQRRQISSFRSEDGNKNKAKHKSLPVLRHMKAAVKKVAGIFTVLFGQRKAASKAAAVNETRKNNSHIRMISSSTDRSAGSETRSKSSSKSKLSQSTSSSSGLIETTNFSFEEILNTTEKFSPANKIGEGAFGTVYKGRLADGSLVAVKRARKAASDKLLAMVFNNEILTLSTIEHLNLVRLYGYLEHEMRGLLWLNTLKMERFENTWMSSFHEGTYGNGLETGERLDIAIDVAHAITYLHMYTDPPIIHRDINSLNILITEKLRAKVADFGFARLSANPSAAHISTQVKGTAGYLDPEYLKTYQLTVKSDVYSFGVLLVELMTGRRPIEPQKPINERITTKWTIQMLKPGDAIFVMDPRLRRNPALTMVLEKILLLARECLAPLRQSRPSMKKCGEVLWGIRKDFHEKSISSSSSADHFSANYPVRDAKMTRQTIGWDSR